MPRQPRQIKVNVRKRPWKNSKGKQWAWACEYTLKGQRYCETQGQNKHLADERAREIELEVYRKEHTPRSHSLTVSEFARQVETEWQDRELIGNLRASTHKMYQRVLHNQIVPLLGDELVCDVDTDKCQAIVRQFMVDGNPGKAETFVRVVSVVMSLAIRKKQRATHPFVHDPVKLPPSCKRHESDMPTLAKLGRLLEIVETRSPCQQEHTPLWTEAYLKLALFQGLRLQEASALPYKFVDLENGILKIRQSWCKDTHRAVPRLKSDNGYRDLPLDVSVEDVIHRISWYQKKNHQSEDIILVSPRSGICTYNSVRTHYWPKLMKKAGYMHVNKNGNLEPDFDYHSLRHMYGSLLLKKGVPITEAAVLMGDSLETFTRVYAHEIKDVSRGREAMGLISQDLMSRRAAPLLVPMATRL